MQMAGGVPEHGNPYLSQHLLHSYSLFSAHIFRLFTTVLFHHSLPRVPTQQLPLCASEHSCLLLLRVPQASSFVAHCCHACYSPLGTCAIPTSASNLNIRIYVTGLAECRMPAIAIHLLQEDGKGKSCKDISHC